MGNRVWRAKEAMFGISKRNNSLMREEDILLLNEFSKVTISVTQWGHAYKYCQEKFYNNWIWTTEVITNRITFYFLNEEDAVVFKLTWCSGGIT